MTRAGSEISKYRAAFAASARCWSAASPSAAATPVVTATVAGGEREQRCRLRRTADADEPVVVISGDDDGAGQGPCRFVVVKLAGEFCDEPARLGGGDPGEGMGASGGCRPARDLASAGEQPQDGARGRIGQAVSEVHDHAGHRRGEQRWGSAGRLDQPAGWQPRGAAAVVVRTRVE